ncbi:glycoside hydrolase family 3 protein [Robiginitalea aurantiaca]|uniref:beta-glucosidase n=1 Tax=Robiginitalea aurantiaca TaxID=3056915 RepID=A0ABT7WIF8_9FLAO|nr:glycoside hydrolase family 3 N-terminal domain-containing protein [Robiginitalea aurantiaca]MDM9632604.1 glycoside hydrolase family 3 N-terminal domain-containing protein [Robiginitalea aurantiaca]
MDLKITEAIETERKIDALLKGLTLEQKIGQMTQVLHFEPLTEGEVAAGRIGSVIHTQGPLPGEGAMGWQQRFRNLQEMALASGPGIPLLFGVDAVHGQNTYEGATIFPHNIGLGASQNADLVEKAAAITALEAQATGFNWVFSPCIAIPFNEKWGRVYEAFSESTPITEKLTQASVRGHQGRLSDVHTVMATAKHFVGDGSTENGIEGGATTLSASEIKDRLLPPYRAAVASGVGAVMASFNTFDGIPMHAHRELITGTLKGEMQFDGIVVSDWKAYSRFGEADIINAGIDMVMAVDGDLELFQEGLRTAVETGYVSGGRIDDAVRRILRQKFRLGLFDNPYPSAALIDKIGCQEHRDVARQAVRESLVLLKNKNEVLPVSPGAAKIIVVGAHGDNSGLQSGGWTIDWQGTDRNYAGATTILQGIARMAEGDVIYDAEGREKHPDADLAIICVGEPPYAEFFGDIGHESNTLKLELSKKHKEVIANYHDQGVATVVVLISGRPLVVTPELEKADAFIAAWLPGSEGDGIAEVLFGKYDFKGKLPHCWPASLEDLEGKYGPNFWDDSVTPLFPLGYGLSYG